MPEMSSISSAARLESARKTRSTSCLRSKRLPSCLRTSESSHSSSSCVSFDAKVQVITFERPMENWSDGSWTKHFGVYWTRFWRLISHNVYYLLGSKQNTFFPPIYMTIITDFHAMNYSYRLINPLSNNDSTFYSFN
jgi:hypothetical protein